MSCENVRKHPQVSINIKKVTKKKRVFVQVRYYDNTEYQIFEFWIDFSGAARARTDRLAFQAVDVVSGWFIPILKRWQVLDLEMVFSHEPNLDVIQCWALLCNIRILSTSYDLERSRSDNEKIDESTVCISWGGGKDSSMALWLLNEVASVPRVLLFDFLTHKSDKVLKKKVERRGGFMFNDVNDESGKQVVRVFSNVGRCVEMPNTSIYLAFVPFLVEAYGIDIFAFSFEAMFFKDGNLNRLNSRASVVSSGEHYAMARTLSLKILSRALTQHYGRRVEVFNSNYHLTEFSCFICLARRAPKLLDEIMMCENADIGIKWCGRCSKCAQYVLYSIALGIEQHQIETEGFLQSSPWMLTALERAGASAKRPAPWYKGLTYPGHIDSFRHVMYRIDGRLSELSLSRRAYGNVSELVQGYKDESVCMEDGFFVKNLFSQWPSEYAYTIYEVMKEVLPRYDTPPFVKHWGNTAVFRNEEFQTAERAAELIERLSCGS